MPAAGDEDAGVLGCDNGTADVEAVHGSARRFPIPPDDDRRLVQPVLEASGDDPDDDGVPVFAVGDADPVGCAFLVRLLAARKSVVQGKTVSSSLDLASRRSMKTNTNT